MKTKKKSRRRQQESSTSMTEHVMTRMSPATRKDSHEFSALILQAMDGYIAAGSPELHLRFMLFLGMMVDFATLAEITLRLPGVLNKGMSAEMAQDFWRERICDSAQVAAMQHSSSCSRQEQINQIASEILSRFPQLPSEEEAVPAGSTH